MKILSHHNASDTDALAFIDNNMPVQFLPAYSKFHFEYFGEEIKIFYSEKVHAYMPVRCHNVKSFHFAQILHAPVKECEELSSDLQKEFFDELLDFVKTNNLFDRFIQPHPYGFTKAVPDGVKSCEFGSYIIDLTSQTEEEMLMKFTMTHRQGVRASIKAHAEIKYGKEVIPDFCRIYKATMSRAGMDSEPLDYFKKLYDILGDDHICFGVVCDQGKAVGCLLVLYSRYAAIVTHAGSDMGESKLKGAVKLLHYEMMKKMKSLDVKKYDFVGARINNKNEKLEGVFAFKAAFGGELVKGYLWKKDINPAKTKVFDLLLKVKNFNKPVLADIIDQQE